jgi:peptidoglycan/LPS O-acetylase OafA/YrhL
MCAAPPAAMNFESMSQTRIREFDGLRGAAILMVVLGHYCSGIFQGVQYFAYASMGVDVFFVLSGFLIGGIILDGLHEENFFFRFFRRRAARILPLFYLVLIVSIVLRKYTDLTPWAGDHFPYWTYATFTMNIWSAMQAKEPGLLLGPVWSLSVEEKFYLIAPFLILLTPRKQLIVTLFALCIAAVAFRYAFRPNIYAMELVLPARMDSLVIGVGVAVIQRNAGLMRHKNWWKVALFVIPVVYLPVLAALHGKEFLLAHTFFALITAAYMLIVLSCPDARSPFRASWLAFFAEISYCMYLIHEAVNVLLTRIILGRTIYSPGYDRISVTLLSFAVTVGLAILSRRYFENPILRWESGMKHSAEGPVGRCAVP